VGRRSASPSTISVSTPVRYLTVVPTNAVNVALLQ
jgi:hypothetical protein